MNKEIIEYPFINKLSGCYLLFYKKKLVYVGISYDIPLRLNAHRINKIFDEVKIIIENDYLESIQIENYYINQFNPKYNIAPSKLEFKKLSWKEKFDINKIPYPGGWIKTVES
jgi:excinuclease UvrABC nuclease subunit